MQSQLEELVRRARRRDFANKLLAALVPAVAAALGTFLVVLLAGASLLDWRLCLVVFAGVLGWKLWPLRRLPPLYAIAQRVDRRLDLPDTLSTALYFSRAESRRVSARMKQTQWRQAEECSRLADLRQAAPIKLPRTWRAASVLAVAAAALLGVRFSRHGTLDLRPPIAQAVLGALGLAEGRVTGNPLASNRLPFQRLSSAELRPDEGLPLGDGAPADVASANADVPEISNEGAVPYRSHDRPEPSAPAEESVESMANGPAEGNSNSDDSSVESRSPSRREPNSPRPSPRPEDSGLLARLRDAMADLLNRLKIQPDFGETRAVAGERGRAPSDRQQPGPGQKAMPGRSNESVGDAAADNLSQSQAGDEIARGGRGQSGDRSGDEPAPGKERSGIGKEEGNKEPREAEQLAAMGKISELIGRRAQNVSGEVTVEVLSSRQQQLKTPYSEKGATHGDSGGQIHRDEIPLVYQGYIQRYFEEVHKNAPAPR